MLATLLFIAMAGLLVWSEERAGPTLERFKHWLVSHSRIPLAVVLGLVLLAQGVASLIG